MTFLASDWGGALFFLALLWLTGFWVSREAKKERARFNIREISRAEAARFSRSSGKSSAGTAERRRAKSGSRSSGTSPTRNGNAWTSSTAPHAQRRDAVRSPLARRAEDEARGHLERWTR